MKTEGEEVWLLTSTGSANKAPARRYFDLYAGAQTTKVVFDLLIEDATWSVPGMSELEGTQTRAKCVEAMLITASCRSMARWSFTLEQDMIAEGDRVVQI